MLRSCSVNFTRVPYRLFAAVAASGLPLIAMTAAVPIWIGGTKLAGFVAPDPVSRDPMSRLGAGMFRGGLEDGVGLSVRSCVFRRKWIARSGASR